MHQRIGFPNLLSVQFCLKKVQRKSAFAQLLYNHILIRSMKIVVVLKCIIIEQIFPDIIVFYCFRIVKGIDNACIRGIAHMRITIDGKSPKPVEPLFSKRVIRIQPQSTSQYISFPAIFLGFGVALISGWDGACKFVIALSLYQIKHMLFLNIGEPLVLKKSSICNRHCPQ